MTQQCGVSASSAEQIAASQWRQIVNSATDTAIITIDPNGRVTSWNDGAVRILGWSEAEMLG
jgi:PAS domain S-box-containing protein